MFASATRSAKSDQELFESYFYWRAGRAREDLAEFFEFVMREENTGSELAIAPHQKVILSFVQHPAHRRAVLIVPVEHSKTFLCTTIALWALARNPNMSGMIVSAAEQTAAKPLSVMLQIIEDMRPQGHCLRAVSPRLHRSRLKGAPWSNTRFTVDRDHLRKDPSFAAVGLDSLRVPGSRLNFLLIDDVVTQDSVTTPEQRQKLDDRITQTFLTRLLPDARVVFCNTTFHPDDAINRFSKRWPALVMSANGTVKFRNADPGWATPELAVEGLEPDSEGFVHARLSAHEPDPESATPLWPERFSRARLEDIRTQNFPHDPGAYARAYLSDTHDESTALCKREFIDRCKAMARERGCYVLASHYSGDCPTFTGVDLAFSVDSRADMTAFFTFMVTPDGKKVILDVEAGRWDANVVQAMTLAKQQLFHSQVFVENNAGQQMFVDFTLALDKYLPIQGHATTAHGKANPTYGVAAMFGEFARGEWLIPNDARGICPKAVQDFVDDCINYSPSRHVADRLMAAYMARQCAAKNGMLLPPVPERARGAGLNAR